MRSSARSRSSFQPANASRAGADHRCTAARRRRRSRTARAGRRSTGSALLRAFVDRLAGEDGDVAGLRRSGRSDSGRRPATRKRPSSVSSSNSPSDCGLRRRAATLPPRRRRLKRVSSRRAISSSVRGVEAQRRRAERDLGARAVVGGDAVAGRQRPVALDRDPLVRSRAVQPDLAARPRSGAPPGPAGRRRAAPRADSAAPSASSAASATDPEAARRGRCRASAIARGTVRTGLHFDLHLRGFGATPSLRRLLQRPARRRVADPVRSGDTFLYTRRRQASRAGDHAAVSRRRRHRARERARW